MDVKARALKESGRATLELHARRIPSLFMRLTNRLLFIKLSKCILLYMLSELDDELHVFILSFCTGEQCSSYEALDTAAGKCHQLIIDNAAAARSFKLECLNQYFHYCRRSWCQHLTSCLRQTQKWKYFCRLKFLWYTHFNITSLVRGMNSSSVRFYVKLCYKDYHRRNYTITLTEHES